MPSSNVEIIDGIKFKSNTQKLIIYKLYKQNKSTEEIVSETGISKNNVVWYINHFRHVVEVSESVPTIAPESAQKLLEIEFKIEGDNLILYAKTSPEFEKFMKDTKQLKTTERLWGTNKTGEYYQMAIATDYLDDINLPVFYKGKINFAILRIKGISEGKKFPVEALLSEKQLNEGVKKLLAAYKKIYDIYMRQGLIQVKGEVYLQ